MVSTFSIRKHILPSTEGTLWNSASWSWTDKVQRPGVDCSNSLSNRRKIFHPSFLPPAPRSLLPPSALNLQVCSFKLVFALLNIQDCMWKAFIFILSSEREGNPEVLLPEKQVSSQTSGHDRRFVARIVPQCDFLMDYLYIHCSHLSLFVIMLCFRSSGSSHGQRGDRWDGKPQVRNFMNSHTLSEQI